MQSDCRKIAGPFNGCGFCLFYHGVSAFETENFESKIYPALAGVWFHYVDPGGVPPVVAILCAVGRDCRPNERPFLGGFLLYHYDFDGVDRHRFKAKQSK